MNHSTELYSSTEMAPEEFDSRRAVACVILGLSFLVGAPGNLLVIWTILRHVKQRSHTVVLILHLAVADLLVLITLPIWIYSLAKSSWVFGEATCKALVYIIIVCMFSSIFFITFMSVERYFAVCQPFVMMRWRTRSVMNGCLVILWLLALLLGVPASLTQSFNEANGTNYQCLKRELSSMAQEIILLCLKTVVGFIVPFIILSVCYCLVAAQLKKMRFNSKQKSMILVHSVVIAFILCWLPYHVINIIDLVCILGSDTEDECVPESIAVTSGALVFISSSVNPVLYAFFARSFRGSFEKFGLVKLFQEMTTHTNKLRELVVQQKTDQRAADTKIELMPDSVCKNKESLTL